MSDLPASSSSGFDTVHIQIPPGAQAGYKLTVSHPNDRRAFPHEYEYPLPSEFVGHATLQVSLPRPPPPVNTAEELKKILERSQARRAARLGPAVFEEEQRLTQQHQEQVKATEARVLVEAEARRRAEVEAEAQRRAEDQAVAERDAFARAEAAKAVEAEVVRATFVPISSGQQGEAEQSYRTPTPSRQVDRPGARTPEKRAPAPSPTFSLEYNRAVSTPVLTSALVTPLQEDTNQLNAVEQLLTEHREPSADAFILERLHTDQAHIPLDERQQHLAVASEDLSNFLSPFLTPSLSPVPYLTAIVLGNIAAPKLTDTDQRDRAYSHINSVLEATKRWHNANPADAQKVDIFLRGLSNQLEVVSGDSSGEQATSNEDLANLYAEIDYLGVPLRQASSASFSEAPVAPPGIPQQPLHPIGHPPKFLCGNISESGSATSSQIFGLPELRNIPCHNTCPISSTKYISLNAEIINRLYKLYRYHFFKGCLEAFEEISNATPPHGTGGTD